MKKFIISILLAGLMLASACSPAFLQQSANATGTKLAQDFFGTQTGIAYPTYLAQMVNATATAMAESFYATQTKLAYQQPTIIPFTLPTAAATSSSSSAGQAVVNVESLSIRSGPGTAYDVLYYAVRGDKLSILGQAYKCDWLKVKTTAGKTGWVSAAYLVYSMACGEIAQAEIPPVPTKAAVVPTQPGGGGGGSCSETSSITVVNHTAGYINVSLSGPKSYSVYLANYGDSQNVPVCPGSYTWHASGAACGDGTGSINSGETLTLSCT